MRKLTVGSLFAGIGGFDLGLERTGGFEVKWQVEIDPYCQRVLAKHWPHVKRYGDIRTVDFSRTGSVDLLCGGFPCQDIASNGTKQGIDGPKSKLWGEYLRAISAVRPRFVVVENVSDLLVRGLGRVLGDLAGIGYDAEWESLPAVAFGLPQRRWRVFIIAYPGEVRCEASDQREPRRPVIVGRFDNDGLAKGQHAISESVARLGGMDDGVPRAMDRVAALGNAVVPQIAEWIGNRILDYERPK